MKPPSGSKPDRFPWRFGFYLIVFFYLAGDLYFFKGPIRQAIDARKENALQNAPDQSQWLAIVNQEPITKRQVDVALMQHLFSRGRDIDQLSEKNEQILRFTVLQELINDVLIQQYSRGAKFEAPRAEIDDFIVYFESQFETPEELESRSEEQKLTTEGRHEALADVVNQKRWIDSRIGKAVEVTDEEASAWFEENREKGEGFTNPERFRARHIFISTVIDDGPERFSLIRGIHGKITVQKADFAAMALQYSEDQRTKKLGGDLNWFTENRMPDDFFRKVKMLNVGEISEPFLTKIGWHIVQLIEKKPAELLNFETLKPEIVARLKSERQSARVKELYLKLRRVASIKVFTDRL